MKKLPQSSFFWFGSGSVSLILALVLIAPKFAGAGNVIFGILGGVMAAWSAYSWYTFGKLKKKEEETADRPY
jgi:hypothetical protein